MSCNNNIVVDVHWELVLYQVMLWVLYIWPTQSLQHPCEISSTAMPTLGNWGAAWLDELVNLLVKGIWTKVTGLYCDPVSAGCFLSLSLNGTSSSVPHSNGIPASFFCHDTLQEPRASSQPDDSCFSKRHFQTCLFLFILLKDMYKAKIMTLA